MQAWLANLWDTFRTSFWFVPILLTLAALTVGTVMPEMESRFLDGQVTYPSWFTSTPAAARSAMSAIAGAMVTVAGIVFSITIVGLTLTSQQYGPRLLRTFMANRITQFALGAFIATSLYCLLVLRYVRETGPEPFVPNLSVSLGVALAVFCIGMLIYFNHAVAMAIQAPNVVASVAAELDSELKRLFSKSIGEVDADAIGVDQATAQLAGLSTDFAEVRLKQEGYLQAVDGPSLLHTATSKDVVIKLHLHPGDFGVRGVKLAYIWPSERSNDDLEELINDAVITGIRRTPRQDIICAVEELVEVAVRSLSPGINDPFTAIACIDRLRAFLSRLVTREMANPYRFDPDGHLRVIVPPTDFSAVLAAAFSQIRQYGRDSVAVSIRLLESLETIATFATREEDLAAIAHHAEMIIHGCEAAFGEASDRVAARQLYERVLEIIDQRRET